MSRLVAALVIALVTMSVLVSAGPTLVGLVHAVVPLVVVLGLVVLIGRIVWYLTSRY